MTQASNLGKGGSNFNSSGQLSLTTGVTGTLPAANGGTGTTTFPAPGTNGNLLTSNGTTWTSAAPPAGMIYPGAGIANSTGTAWGTSYTTTGTGTVVALATSPSFTTPSLGAATGTTLTLSGQLAVNNTVYVNSGTGAADYNDLNLGGVGGWAGGESHGINTYYGSIASPTIFSRLDTQFSGTAAVMRWKNFYYSGAQTSTVMTLTAASTTTANLNVTGSVTATSFSGSGSSLTGIPTSIVAGTGISVSGATGAVTITNTATSAYVGQRAQLITSTSTFTIPTSVTALKITVVGGGGGGSGYYYSSLGSCGSGGTGGTTTVASGTQTITSITATGGQGGQFVRTPCINFYSGNPGKGTAGSLLYQGGSCDGRAAGGSMTASVAATSFAGSGFLGGWGGDLNNLTQTSPTGYGNGGYPAGATQNGGAGWGGSGGGVSIQWLTGLTPGNTLSITIGAGGTAGAYSTANVGNGPGSAGAVLIEW
jgi:hypothetical protein